LASIKVLEQHVADLIAAGEVVSRPASVVKELVENSIDAGATIITVEISSGGMALIRVTDNGSGIASGDIKTAFLRHATSKLHDARGLEAIETLGFRGEALAAIAAVSRVEINTRTQAAHEGTALVLNAGEALRSSPVGCPVGTTIIVRDLFFNTPARLKFMKTDRAEGSAVSSTVLRCALSRPDISFRFIKDGKTEYHTPGDCLVDSCIYSLLGRDIEAGFAKVELKDEAVSVKGFASKPDAARGNRTYQFFFVNGRAVRSLLLQSALEQAYKNSLMSGRFPACVLYIETTPASVDVNVHPAKAEVKFVSDKQIFDGVYYAVLSMLEQNSKAGEPQQQPPQYDFASIQSAPRDLFVSEPIKEYKSPAKTNMSYTPPPVRNISRAYIEVPDYKIIGEALGVYIILEYEDCVLFIDKHAVHERIHFDALKSGDYQPMSEALLTPVICRVGHEDTLLLEEVADFLDKLGFTVERFGEDSVAVRHIPADIGIGDVEFVLSEMCVQLRQGGALEPANLDKIYKALACKAAIKAGSMSDIKELKPLVEKVISGAVTHCPHGRPVTYRIPKAALEKSFGRI